jgi:glucose uptake protein GlcU
LIGGIHKHNSSLHHPTYIIVLVPHLVQLALEVHVLPGSTVILLIAQSTAAIFMLFHHETLFLKHFFQLGHAALVVILDGFKGGGVLQRKTRKKDKLVSLVETATAIHQLGFFITKLVVHKHVLAVVHHLLLDSLGMSILWSRGQSKGGKNKSKRELHGNDVD